MSSSTQTLNSLSTRSPNPSPDPSDLLAFNRSLQAAIYEADFDQVDTILQTWTSTPSLPPTPQDDLGSALASAASCGHVSVVRLLLDHGAPITRAAAILTTRDDNPNTLAIFKSFLQHGWSPQDATCKDGTMIMCLIMSNTDNESLLQ